jgi:hypothetical protein
MSDDLYRECLRLSTMIGVAATEYAATKALITLADVTPTSPNACKKLLTQLTRIYRPASLIAGDDRRALYEHVSKRVA